MPKNGKSLSDIWNLKRRGKRDSDRHKELVKDAIRKHGKDLITEYNVITTDGNKKIKVPIKFLDQYKFKYGNLNKNGGVGQGVSAKPGDKFRIGKGKPDSGKPGVGRPGDEAGPRTFDAEVSIDELVDVLLKELDLPWMEPNTGSSIAVEYEEVDSVEKRGITPDLDLKRTILQNIKRNAAKGNAKIGGINESDFRYRSWDTVREYHSNAVIYAMMDRSGSMTEEKRYIAKSFYFWMVQFLKRRYDNIKLVFIAHDTEAFIVDEEQFFSVNSGGGTKCSSAFKMAYEHILSNHPPEEYNNYIMEWSDGDNWGEDNLLCVEYIKKLLPLTTAIGYGEIIPNAEQNRSWIREGGLLSDLLAREINRTRFVSMRITEREQVFDALKVFFNIDNISKKSKKE
jgi:sporulation protein YhbH